MRNAKLLLNGTLFAAFLIFTNGCKKTGGAADDEPVRKVSTNAVVPVTLAIDYSAPAGYPSASMLRGYILRDVIALKNTNIMNDLAGYNALGCKLVCLPRDLNQFNAAYTGSNYYKSYRSIGPAYFGGEPQPEEFRTVGGVLSVSVNPNFLSICNEAKNQNLRMIIQAAGTPVQGNNDGSVTQLFPLDATRQFHQSARFYALPAPASYNAAADAVYLWMKAIKDGTNANNIIWAGHQEPSHTVGYPNGVQTPAGTEDNIDDYALAFKPLAQKIKNGAIGSVAGIQLNQDQAGYARATAALHNNGVPIDLFSIQNYKGEKNQVVIDEAVARLNAHSSTAGKKLIFNRYDFDAGISDPTLRYNSSAGMTQFLKNELVILNKADKLTGYCLFTGAYGKPMMNAVMKFLNTQPVTRRNITGIASGVNAWCTADGNGMYMALWNSAADARTITVNLSNFPAAYGGYVMNIRKASGTTLANYPTATWTPATNGQIGNISLEPNEFVLIQLNASGTSTASIAANQKAQS
ncbi:MAG: hypothetical protein AAGC65_14830 [Mucilaginibacter sp.]|uniref:hypothetical protein n=1 Tax=Mucilaginibacter sp. TaxID=1882438 RepID=UPI0031AC85D6